MTVFGLSKPILLWPLMQQAFGKKWCSLLKKEKVYMLLLVAAPCKFLVDALIDYNFNKMWFCWRSCCWFLLFIIAYAFVILITPQHQIYCSFPNRFIIVLILTSNMGMLLSAELKKKSTKPKRPSIKTLFGKHVFIILCIVPSILVD